MMETPRPIPGYENYSITADGLVYCGSRLLKARQSPGRAARVKLKNSEGKFMWVAIAKLVAISFIPNPEQHKKIIFKDRDKNNCRPENIQWVSAGAFSRFVNHHAEIDNLLGPPKPKRAPDWIDPQRVALEGYPGYYLTPKGVLYKGDRICKPSVRKNKSTRVRIWQQGRYKFFGLAKLVATYFVANPRQHRYIIFKDRNNKNCCADNIAWVDGETYTYYCGIHIGGKKIVLPREEAIRRCTDIYLRNYYKTLDERWLHECWEQVEKNIKLPDWDACRSECYMYFIDRVRRYSLLHNPAGMLVLHMKGIRARIRKEISPDMPVSKVVKTDESLRVLRGRKYYE